MVEGAARGRRRARGRAPGYNMHVLEPIPLSVSLAGLDPSPGHAWSGGVRGAIAWAGGLGVRRVRLDGAASGARARELDRGARRDLAALLRRRELLFCGIDLWIPAAHFADSQRVDRAVEASVGAVRLAADLARLGDASGGPVVSVAIGETPVDGVVASLSGAASEHGVAIADHGGHAGLGRGIDPASVLLAGDDPASLATGGGVTSARLSDADASGRCPVGAHGRLDVAAYGAALSVGGYTRDVVIDLRGLVSQGEAARRAMEVWRSATSLPG